MNKERIKVGDLIEFDASIHFPQTLESTILKGEVTKVLDNSVIVKVSDYPKDQHLYENDLTVVNMKNFQILQTA